MPQLQLKPTHRVVQDYYESLAQFAKLGIKHEGAVRSAFQTLLESCGRQFEWKLVPEYRSKGKGSAQVQVDGALLDQYGLVHGYWEAKDSADDLNEETKAKFTAGYPRDNILFQEPLRAVLFQQGRDVFAAALNPAPKN